MDYFLWAILESKVRTKKYSSLETLKKDIVREWAKIAASYVRATRDLDFERFKAIVTVKGGHIELKYVD